MKKLLLALILLLGACTPMRYVNVDVHSRHNYYERHRYNTYTSPIWVPGMGIILQTHILPKRQIITPQRKWSRPLPQRTPRGKH